jgi:23S rRNA (uracil1939-C5)-methyltransferase
MEKPFTLTLTALAHSGDALGRLPDGRAVFVPFALPGERVRVRLIEERKRYARAELLEVLTPADERLTPRCAHFTLCGGCQFQHMPYEMQLQAKWESLRSHLTRTGGLDDPPLQPIVPSPARWNYRNHVRFQLTTEGQVGFTTADGARVFPISECHLPQEVLNRVWPLLDVESLPGLEHLSLRAGVEEDVLLVLESRDASPPAFFVDVPLSAVHLSPAGRQVLSGSAYTVIEVLGHPFRVGAASFFQVNTPMAEKMVQHVLAHLPQNLGEVLELYCGVGLFSAFLAPRAEKLVAVEASPGAAEDFVINLDAFDHVSLYEAAVEDVLPQLDLTPDLILADPPRSGLGRRVVEQIVALQPALLIYVSCNPATLARDAKLLREGGYCLMHLTPFDLFPQTHHVESISFWECEKE